MIPVDKPYQHTSKSTMSQFNAMAETSLTSTETVIDLHSEPDGIPLAILGPPRHVASMSITEDLQVLTDNLASLRCFTPPSAHANLKIGYEPWKRRCQRDQNYRHIVGHPRRLDRILQMCLESKASDDLLQAQVVTYRGVMTK